MLLCLSIVAIASVAIASTLGVYSLAFKPSAQDSQDETKQERTQNRFVHRVSDPEAATQSIEAAWKRFQTAKGAHPRRDEKPPGLSDQEIDELERKMLQRLPSDLKAFLKVYRSHGDWFNDLRFYTSDQLYSSWIQRSTMGLGMTIGNSVRYGGPHDGQPGFCDPSVFIFAREDVNEIGYDLRSGKVIEVMDCDAGWAAASLEELLNEMARHLEEGKQISTYYMEIEDLPNADDYRAKLLDSAMWKIYDLPPELERSHE